jgi:hypothetical protein
MIFLCNVAAEPLAFLWVGDTSSALTTLQLLRSRKGIPIMSTLTHHFDDSLHSPERQNIVRTSTARKRLAAIKRLCLGALPLLLTGGLLVGLIALRTAIYFSRIHY